MNLTEALRQQLIQAYELAYPNEMCGVIVQDADGYQFINMQNCHADPKRFFKIDARELADIYTAYAVTAFVHSHPDASPAASASDVTSMNEQNKPFVIVGMDNKIAIHYPHAVPLVGRQYVHGKQDCYTIVRDYYARELGIVLPDFERSDKWWEKPDHTSLYVDNFSKAGFVAVNDSVYQAKRHDVMLFNIGNTFHINHAMIYLHDNGTLNSEETTPMIAQRIALHHPYNGLGIRINLGDNWLSHCRLLLRHESLLEAV